MKAKPIKKISLVLFILTVGSSALLAGHKNNDHNLIKNFLMNFSLASKASTFSSYSTEKNSSIIFSFKDDPESVRTVFTDLNQFAKLSAPRKKKLRAGLEFGSLIVYSQVNYWIKYSHFIEDWQYKLRWEDQKRRFFTFEANRFDSNDFGLNWRHSLAGMIYYEFARSNNLSWLQSTIFSVGGSLYWEYFVEWREVISINDNIMTGLGGVVLGESWFQLGRYFFNSSNPVSHLFSWLNPFMKINGWFDRKQMLPPYFHSHNPQVQDVYLFLGYRNSPTSTSNGNAGNLAVSLGSRIITASGYGIPGKIDERFTSPIYSQLDVDFMYHGNTREELAVTAKIVPLGRFIQNISEDNKGYSFYYGLGSAFYVYVKRPVVDYDAEKVSIDYPEDFHFENPREFRDKLGAVHIIGPVFDVAYFSRPWFFRLRTEGYLSFGMINAWALNKYSLDYPVQGMKTTLTYYGYYYALGPALESSAEIGYQNLRLDGFINYQYYRSLQGRDRFQDKILDDSVIRDSRWHSGLKLQYHIPRTDFSFVGAVEWVKRWGKIHEVEDSNLEKRYYLGLKFNL
jgi:hypothetical protein